MRISEQKTLSTSGGSSSSSSSSLSSTTSDAPTAVDDPSIPASNPLAALTDIVEDYTTALAESVAKETAAFKQRHEQTPAAVYLVIRLPHPTVLFVSGEQAGYMSAVLKDKVNHHKAASIPSIAISGSLQTWQDLIQISAGEQDSPQHLWSTSRIVSALEIANEYEMKLHVLALYSIALSRFPEDPEGIQRVFAEDGDATLTIKKAVDRMLKYEALIAGGHEHLQEEPSTLLANFEALALENHKLKSRDRLEQLVALMSSQTVAIQPCTHDRCWWNIDGKTKFVDEDPVGVDGVYRSAATIRWEKAIELVKKYLEEESELPSPSFVLKECEMDMFKDDSCWTCKPELRILFRLVRALARERKLL